MFWKYNKQDDVLQWSWTSTLYAKEDPGDEKQKQISHNLGFFPYMLLFQIGHGN